MAKIREDQPERVAGGNRWKMTVELTFDVLPEDCETKYPGDSLVDFQNRAFDRVKPMLNDLVFGGKLAHFHVVEKPQGCFDA